MIHIDTPWYSVKNRSEHAWLDIQTHVLRYPNTCVWKINFQKNAVLEQIFIDLQDKNNHSMQLTLTFTLQFKNIPEFNWSNIPRTLLSPSKSSLLVLVVSVTLLDVQGPSSLDTLGECLCKSGPVDCAWDTDFARFSCVVRHSCTYTKTTIRLIGSLYFSQFYGN